MHVCTAVIEILMDNTRPEISPHLQTPGKKESRTPQVTMATRRCRNRSNEEDDDDDDFVVGANLKMVVDLAYET